jgi:DNA helicase-2/ATP-dependent DNA helicase PcrA
MQRRVERITSEVLGPNARALGAGMNWSGTFHAMGARLLREYAPEIGLNREFTIHDREDSADLMNLVRHDLGLSNKDRRFPMKGTCLSIYSRTVNAQANLEEILDRHFSWCAEWETELRRLFAAYVEAKQVQNVLDYDDLLLYWAHMMAEGSVAEQVAARFDHVLVDEYQDTNLLQARILKGMCAGHRKLTVVGDDAQSIYSFRGAHFRNILDFPKAFPDTTLVTLAQNYRSTTPILTLSNTLISRAEERFTKDLWTTRPGGEKPWLVTAKDEAQQTRFVVDRVLQLHEGGVPLGEMAVLFRAGYMSADLEIELTNRKIPFE